MCNILSVIEIYRMAPIKKQKFSGRFDFDKFGCCFQTICLEIGTAGIEFFYYFITSSF